MEYNFAADCLNKYSQLTPWVQALLGVGGFTVLLGAAYFVKETVAVMMRPFQRTQPENTATVSAHQKPKLEWRDKYYRDENTH